MAVKKPVFVRAGFPFNYDADAVSEETGLRCLDVSLAKQSFAEECDINTIVRRFGLTGQVPEGVRLPTYGDFEGVSSYQEALNAMIQAESAFGAMPAEVRSRFNNDPGLFVDFCSNPDNRDELRKLGLAVPEVVPVVVPPQEVVVVDDKRAPKAPGTVST